MTLRVRVEGYIEDKYGKEELKPYDWDIEYLKAWLTDNFNPENNPRTVCLKIKSIGGGGGKNGII